MRIAEAFAAGDFLLAEARPKQVAAVDPDTAAWNAASAAPYGSPLTELDQAVWQWSVYRWAGTGWDFSSICRPSTKLSAI